MVKMLNGTRSQLTLLLAVIVGLALSNTRAGVAIKLPAESDEAGETSSEEELYNKLIDKMTDNEVESPERVLEMLNEIKSILDDQKSADSELKSVINTLISFSKLRTNKCTARYQSILAEMSEDHGKNILKVYLDHQRTQQKDYCYKTYTTRLSEAAESLLELESIERPVKKFAKFVAARGLASSSTDLTIGELPFDTLMNGLREFVSEVMTEAQNDGESEDESIDDNLKAMNVLNSQLIVPCQKLTNSFDHFLEMLELFDKQPEGITEQLRQTLWLTSICKSLEFRTFHKELKRSYKRTPPGPKLTVSRFVHYLGITNSFSLLFQSQLDTSAIKEALEKMADSERADSEQSDSELTDSELTDSELEFWDLEDEGAKPSRSSRSSRRSRRSRSSRRSSPSRPSKQSKRQKEIQSVIRPLVGACEVLFRSLDDFLWIIDLRLKRIIEPYNSIRTLEEARVCQIFINKSNSPMNRKLWTTQ